MSSHQVQSLLYPVAQRKRVEETMGSMAPAEHSPESLHRFPNSQALHYNGAYYAYDTIVQDGANLPPPWSPSNGSLLNGRNPMIHSPKGPLRNHMAYRPENLPFSAEGNQAPMAQELSTKQGFTYYSRSPGMRSPTDPGVAAPVAIRKHTAGGGSLSPPSGSSPCLAVPKPVYGHSPCCSELGCSAGHRYSAEHGAQRAEPGVYEDDWALHDRRALSRGKSPEAFAQQRAMQLDCGAERPPPRAAAPAEEYLSTSPGTKRTLPAFMEPNYSTFPCPTSRSLVVPSVESYQRLQIPPKAFHGMYASHPPTYKHMTSLHHGAQSQLYQDHSHMSKYGQLTQQPVFYYSQANVEMGSGAAYKNVGGKHSEDVDPSVHKRTPPTPPAGHYLVSQPTFSDVPVPGGPMAPLNDAFLRGFEHSSYPVYRMRLIAGQMRSVLERQTVVRPGAPPHNLHMGRFSAPPHTLHMDRSGAPQHTLHMDRSGAPQHTLHMDRSGAPQHTLHMDRSGAPQHTLHMDRSGAPQHALHMDRSGAPQHTLHMDRSGAPQHTLHMDRPGMPPHGLHLDQPSAPPHGLHMDRPSASPHSLYMERPSNPPFSPQSDRPLDYSLYRTPLPSPRQHQVHPDFQRASLAKQSPVDLGNHIPTTSPKQTTDPLRITGSPVICSKGNHIPPSNAHVTDCKSLKRPLNHQSTPSTYKEDGRDVVVDIDPPKRRRKVETDPERAGSCPSLTPSSMPVISSVFSLAPYRAYLEAAGMLPPTPETEQPPKLCLVKAEPCMRERRIRQDGEKPLVRPDTPKEKPVVRPDTPKEKPVVKMLELRKIKMEPLDRDGPLDAGDCHFKANPTGVKEEVAEKDSSNDGLILVIKKCEPDELESRPLKPAKDESSLKCNADPLPANERVRSVTPGCTPQPCQWIVSSHPKSVTPPQLPVKLESRPLKPAKDESSRKCNADPLPAHERVRSVTPGSTPQPCQWIVSSHPKSVTPPQLPVKLESRPLKPAKDESSLKCNADPLPTHERVRSVTPGSTPQPCQWIVSSHPKSVTPPQLPVKLESRPLKPAKDESSLKCNADPLPAHERVRSVTPGSTPQPSQWIISSHPKSVTPPQLPVSKPDLKKIPPQSLMLSTFKIVLPDLLRAAPPTPQPPERPQPPPAEAEVTLTLKSPDAGVPRQARQHFMELHQVLCKLLSSTVSQTPEQEVRSWLSKLEPSGRPSPSIKAQNVSGLLGAKVREMWLSDYEISTALQRVQQRLREYIGQQHSPFPHVIRAGAMFIPMLVVKEILFPQIQGTFIDQVLQEHKVELRPTTLSEEKILTQHHKRAGSSKLRRLLSLKHLPEIYLDVLNLFYHSCVCKRLESTSPDGAQKTVQTDESTRKGREEGREEVDRSRARRRSREKADGSRALRRARTATSPTLNRDSRKRLKDLERGLHFKKHKRKSRKKHRKRSRSKRVFLERSPLSEDELLEYTERAGNWSIVNTSDEGDWDGYPVGSRRNRGSKHAAAGEGPSAATARDEEPKASWMCPLTSDELSSSSSDDDDAERVGASSRARRGAADESRSRRRQSRSGMILKLRRVLLDTGRRGREERYQADSNPERRRRRGRDRGGGERDLSGRSSSPVARRGQREASFSRTLRPGAKPALCLRRSLVKIKYCPYLSVCHSAEHRRRWVLRSAVQRARRAMKMYYPDLVGKRIRHLYEEMDKTEVWYRGLVVRVHEQHPNPLKTVFEVQYDSEPEWQYYLELLIDYKKGWLKIDD